MPRKLPRGVYHDPHDPPGLYRICWFDQFHRRHREVAGPLSHAVALYGKRKADVLQRRKLPELSGVGVRFADLAQAALEYSRAHKRSHADDVVRMKRLVEWFGEREAAPITPGEIRAMLDAKLKEHSRATWNRYKSLLSMVYRLGAERGAVESNPARMVQRVPENNARVRWLTPEEEKRLRQAVREEWPDKMPELDVALNTGLRCGEQYGLRWEDIDLENRVLTVQRSKHGRKRHVPLNSAAVGALQSVRDGGGAIFTTQKPKHWFVPAVRLAEIPNFTWHDLRHTFASRLVMSGARLESVQKWMGHLSITTTMRYAHLAPGFQDEVLEKLAGFGSEAYAKKRRRGR